MNPVMRAAREGALPHLPLRQKPRVEAGKLKPEIEHRPVFVGGTLANPLGWAMRPYIIGHGQQLARKRLAAKAAWVAETYGARA